MDSLIQTQEIITVGLAFFLAISLYYLLWRPKGAVTRNSKYCRNGWKQQQAVPEPIGALPVIGHLHLLLLSAARSHDNLLHRTFGAMADTYGPVFMIRLGSRRRVLVVSSSELAKECFTKNDRVLATRPSSTAGKHLGYDHTALGFAPYGPTWGEMRKTATSQLLSAQRTQMLNHVRASEIDMSMRELYRMWVVMNGRQDVQAPQPVLVDMKGWIEDLTLNVVVRTLAGKRHFSGQGSIPLDQYNHDREKDSKKYRKAINDFVYLMGVFVVGDAFPWLGWMDSLGHKRAMKRTFKELDSILTRWVEEHRLKRLSSSTSTSNSNSTATATATATTINNNADHEGQGDGERDFIDVMLSILQEKDPRLSGPDVFTAVKPTCLALLTAAGDGPTVTLTWVLSLLLNHRHVLKKAQAELDAQVGRDRQVEESDINNLIYLQAIVKETLRLYPVIPLNLPHQAMEDFTLAGFDVPAGTTVFTNVWKIHRDPRLWTVEFMPERFLNTRADHMELITGSSQNFELMPFGSGRRMCPGRSFALHVLHLTLARLLHEFELSTPFNEPVDMTEDLGLSLFKTTPLDVLILPRLPSNVYGVAKSYREKWRNRG